MPIIHPIYCSSSSCFEPLEVFKDLLFYTQTETWKDKQISRWKKKHRVWCWVFTELSHQLLASNQMMKTFNQIENFYMFSPVSFMSLNLFHLDIIFSALHMIRTYIFFGLCTCSMNCLRFCLIHIFVLCSTFSTHRTCPAVSI